MAHYSKINLTDIANGPGVRVTIFFSGCTHHCKGCFNEETWDYMRERIYNFFKSVVRSDTVANLNERSALNEYGIIAF